MKKLSLLILAFALALSAQAQLHGYKWRFGASAGTTNYLGDVRPFKVDNFQNFTKYYKRYKTYSDQLSYQVSIEYALGNSVGLMLTGGSYQFGSADRFIQNDGTLLTESPTFDRALNFQTDVYDAGLSFVIKPDNNWLLSGKSFFAPYITVGAGVQSFKIHGDLLDSNGNQYDYTNTSLIPDGVFETDLSSLGTERSDGYKTTTFYANLGLGVRFRITKSIELFAQSDFKRTNTDYLDDVSGTYRNSYDNAFQEYAAKPGTNQVTSDDPYRGMENGNPDWYIYHGMGIKFSLGANKKSFNPPVITQRYTYVPTELSNAQMAKNESAEKAEEAPKQVTNNYFTVIQLPANGVSTSTIKGGISDSTELAQLDVLVDSLWTEKVNIQANVAAQEKTLVEIDHIFDLMAADSTLSADIREARISKLQREKTETTDKLSVLNAHKKVYQFKLDSIQTVKGINTPTVSGLDTASLINQLIIYPGQVSKILYSANKVNLATLDSAVKQESPVVSSGQSTRMTEPTNTFTQEQFDEELNKFKKELLKAQATRDSALVMAFSRRSQTTEDMEAATYAPQEATIKSAKREEKLDKKNNELLKDALLVGGTAATTAAISTSGDKKKADAVAANDSTLRARIIQDSLIIDSLSSIPHVVDTVRVTQVVEKTIETLMSESKVEVYFAINESSLTDQERDKLAPIAEYLKKNPEVIVELVGFADNTGSVAYNLTLTEKRVAAVTKVLADHYSIATERISVSNGGLIVRGRSKESVETDRKVEIRLLKK
ncbi:OmpA family protein [Algoriphagus aquimarinus]|uniref:Outer membrane protein OmpA n=1 Tax=Algoriphagus aquimarinus TaxID=237018 RepID=A0A1I1A461_9BACT|nr:OmpA family protein [Algoriphagus aquimarinus]SFB31358.1 Outer membrane protein OmpA [Algoriphagus aquimarinus]